MNASSSRAPRRTGNRPVRVDELGRRLEELGLGHEPDLPAHVAAHQEVVHEREVIRRQDDGAAAGHLLGGDRARTEERVRVQGGEQSRELVRPVGVARTGSLVEPGEVLCGARVNVDLLAHRCEVGHVSLRSTAGATQGYAPRPAITGRGVRPAGGSRTGTPAGITVGGCHTRRAAPRTRLSSGPATRVRLYVHPHARSKRVDGLN